MNKLVAPIKLLFERDIFVAGKNIKINCGNNNSTNELVHWSIVYRFDKAYMIRILAFHVDILSCTKLNPCRDRKKRQRKWHLVQRCRLCTALSTKRGNGCFLDLNPCGHPNRIRAKRPSPASLHFVLHFCFPARVWVELLICFCPTRLCWLVSNWSLAIPPGVCRVRWLRSSQRWHGFFKSRGFLLEMVRPCQNSMVISPAMFSLILSQPQRVITARIPAGAMAISRWSLLRACQETAFFWTPWACQFLCRKKSPKYKLSTLFWRYLCMWLRSSDVVLMKRIVRLPWAESVLGRDGRVTQVRSKVCSEVEGRKKLLAPKINFLWKHAGRRRAFTSITSVKNGDHYFLTTNQHVRNERL